MKKKITAIAMSALLIAGLAGCGSSGTSSASDVQGNTQEASTGEVASDRVQEATIEVWVPKGKQTDFLTHAVEEYNKEYGTNLKLETLDVNSTSLLEKLTPVLASGQEMPEVMFLGDIEAPVVMSKFPDSFVDLTESGYEEEYQDAFFPYKVQLIKNASPDKHMRAMPHDIGGTLMYYRSDLFEQAGVDVNAIETWDELLEAGKKVQDATGVKMLAIEGAGDSYMFNLFVQQQGSYIANEDGEIDIMTPEAEKAMEYVKKIYDSGVADLYASSDERNSKLYTSSVIIEGSWFNGNLKSNNPDLAGKWSVRQVPVFDPNGENYVPVNGGSGWALGANADQKDAAYQLMEYVTTNPEVMGYALNVGASTANKAAYDTEYGQVEDPYYGGVKVWQEALKANDNMAPVNSTVAYWEILTNITLQTGKVWNEGLDVKTALADAAAQASNTTGIAIAQ